MSPQNESNQRQLTLDDPVEPANMEKFSRIRQTREQISNRMVQMELEKVRLLRAYSGLDTEEHRLFEEILLARGLSPTTPVEIIADTGKIRIQRDAAQLLQQQQAPASPSPEGNVASS